MGIFVPGNGGIFLENGRVLMKLEILSFRDRFDILLEKRLSDVAGLKYIRLYGKSQFVMFFQKD